jgi:hypothetical protein
MRPKRLDRNEFVHRIARRTSYVGERGTRLNRMERLWSQAGATMGNQWQIA